jgi:hypothetical protein
MRTSRSEFVESDRGIAFIVNDADECRMRAIECGHSALRVHDDLLSSAYLQLARIWSAIGARAVVNGRNMSKEIDNRRTTEI